MLDTPRMVNFFLKKEDGGRDDRARQASVRYPAVALSLRNTLGAALETFSPRNPPEVTMYTCGPTVYDYVHIGNMRAYVFADTLKRVLAYNGFTVNQTINITDFGHLTDDADAGEDKVMLALKRAGKTLSLKNMRAVTDIFTDAFTEDMDAIGNLPPSQYTRASDYIGEQIALIRALVEKGYTYQTSDGIYFDISRFPEYGALGNINISKLQEGARVEANPEKKHPADFALWKFGSLGWDSAWGKGFPGWHIECTAMAFATLGKQIDIHTGGIDHIATHHNGEIAQAEAATGRSPYVRYWMHGEFITIDATKISKSLGNTITLRQLRDRGFSPIAYRYWLLGGHYRSPMNFSFEALSGARAALFRLRRFVVEGAAFGVARPGAEVAPGLRHPSRDTGNIIEAYRAKFHTAINDDLDTPRALALVWELVKDPDHSPEDKAATIGHFDEIFGLRICDVAVEEARTLGVIEVSDLPEDVQMLLEEREKARAQKDWDSADALREAINLKGYLVEDTPKGVRVTRA